MLGQVVEIQSPGRRLSKDRGHLLIETNEHGPVRIALDDISALLLSNPSAVLTTSLVSSLMERGANIVISNDQFQPVAMILPLQGHYAQGYVFDAQVNATKPTKKRLWAALVRRKIEAQAAALERIGCSSRGIIALLNQLRSGDPMNIEAIAAQRYLPAMFGQNFARNDSKNLANAFLNYGYTILRSATARAIVASGLHPSFSLHHVSAGDALRLADDLMEPFRPSVDLLVWQILQEGAHELNADSKKFLAGILETDFSSNEGVSILSNVLQRLAGSLSLVLQGKKRELSFPTSHLPLMGDQ